MQQTTRAALASLAIVAVLAAACTTNPSVPPGTPGITIDPMTRLATTEAGGRDTFTIVLDAEPTADVAMELSSSDETEGTVSPTSVVFTRLNWNAPQTVTVTGVDDDLVDGEQIYGIVIAAATSDDSRYAGMDAVDVVVANTDDESPGITVAPTTGLETTESGGTDTFTVVLDAEPQDDVTIALSSSDEDEGTVSPATLTFTTLNWNAPQTATVTGVDDDLADGAQDYTIVTAPADSTDTGYDGLNADDVEVSNVDNDSAGVTIDPTSELTTTEAGGTDTFTLVLNTEPDADVTIALSSSDEGEGTVAPASLTFTAANWNAPQEVTVTGVDDDLADGAQPYSIVTAAAVSADAGYDGLDADDVEVSNTDDDSAGITVDPTTGLTTTESGGTAAFTVVLNTEPSADVTIALSSSDEGEGTVSPASLTFTSANWAAPQTVTATGVDDSIADGAQPYTIATAAAVSADTGYDGVDADDVDVSNTDNDSAGITVDPTTGLTTTEAGGAAAFTVVLNTQPSADVTIALSSSDEGEGTVAPASLTFTSVNWAAPRTVTVTGVNDSVADGAQPYNVVTAAAVSADTNYSGLDAANVAVTNTDNDSAGITVTPTTGLTTTEVGGTATFTIVLNSQPTAGVAIALSSSDATEGTVAPASVAFTTANWAAPQTVTVTGVDDAIADGTQPYNVVTAAAVSTDTGYGGLDAANVAVTNTDNDSAGITVTPTTGLTTTEALGTATFTIVLNSQPTAGVSIALSSSDTTEGTAAPATVTFTTSNWAAPQTVTVTGVDDAIADGAQPYNVVTAAAVSTDTGYGGLDAANVAVTNTDNDSAGVTVTPTTGLTTTEALGTATFTVVLNSQPTAAVAIGLSSSDTTEGTVAPATVTFTTSNWAAPQTVTVTGVDDAIADGAQPYTVVTAAAVSADAGYSGLDAANVAVTNTDNDSAGITVAPTSGLVTTEALGTATFTIVLNSQPTAGVSVALSSSDTTEGTVAPASVAFTTSNWAAPQTVTVTGVNDSVADGAQPYTIVTAAAVSADTGYSGVNAADVSVTNTDNDSAGITVVPTSGLVTTEALGTATFTIVLNSQPTAGVSIAVSSGDTTEGTVAPATVTFTTVNWAAAQTVTVTGVDDSVADGAQPYTIATAAAVSTDTGYGGLNAADVSVTNTDNDSAGITVVPTSGLVTTEALGTATFTIVLNSQPTASVAVALSSSDTTEGTAAPATVTFTTSNWAAPQTVTVTGVDDSVADGAQPYTIVTAAAVSTDIGYSGLNASDVSVTNTDNDSAGITVVPTSGLVTTEALGTATFTIVLNSQPTASVAVGLSSSDTTEGTVSPATVTFTTVNWAAPQTVTVTGVDDVLIDGSQSYTIVTAGAVSTDTGYSGLNAADVSATNTDNDSAGFTIVPTSGLTTTEAAGTATFTVVLNAQPTASVSIALSSSDTGEGTVAPASLTFTNLNWAAPQTVTVTGVDDLVADGAQPYTIVTAAAVSADTNYSGLNPADVSVTNTDNDSPGITVVPTSGLTTTEAAGVALFSVVLNSEPTASVSIALSSSDTSEGTVAPASLTFTTLNWAAPQFVTVTGVDDAIQDGTQAYAIVTAPATSADPGYSGLNASDVSVSNVDNDTPGITVTPTSGLATTEALGTATFTIVLNSAPTASVSIALSSNDTGEGTVAPASLTFTTVNWAAPQTVTVTGVDDAIQDGNQPYLIVTAPATSTDFGYSGLNASDVSVTNTDNDTAGVTVTPTSGLTTTEALGTATFTIVLNSEPTAGVSIALSSSDTGEGTVLPVSVTFTTLNWAAPQTVTVTGVDDLVADGNQPYTIVTAAAVSADTNYSGMNPSNVSVTNTDNDSAGITVTPTSGLVTTEALGTDTFTIVLNSEPTASVSIGLSSSDATEGTVSPASVTFTTVNWAAPQTVTATGVDDFVADGAQPYTILTAAATSTDTGYGGLNASDVSVSNTDNDSAGITVTPTSGLVTTEALGTATFTIVLNSQPTAAVAIGLSSSDTTEGTVAPASVTFTTVNWAAPQTVTATGVDDFVADGNQPYTIATAAAVSTDTGYSGRDPSDVSVTNTDNDSAGITVTPTSGLVTTEAAGTATFTIVLNSQPTASVAVGVSSSDTTEGTVSPATVTFTTVNWASPQTVTAVGVDDFVADGNQPYTLVTAAAVSTDPGYGGMDPSDVSASNTDNDSAGITVTPASGLTTTEAAGTATFTIVLNSQPTAGVSIGLSSSDTTEGTVAPASVAFTTVNWAAPQTVTVTGVDDFVADGNQPYTIATAAAVSTDPGYSGIDPSDVSVTNNDNDSAGVTVTPTSGVTTTEAAGTGTFTIVLNSQPTAGVSIALSSSDTTEGTVAPASVAFTTVNWAAPQTVTVTGVDDLVADGNVPYTIVTAAAVSTDPGYSGMNPSDVSVTNTDNDSAGITVTPSSGLTTSETSGVAIFTVVLTSQPTANVTIGISSSDTTEGTAAPSSLTFTTGSWATPQAVTITGVDDFVADGNQPYSVITAPAVSTDPGYSGLDAVNPSVVNIDNDSLGITVTPTSGLVTDEYAGQDTFTLVLNSQPTASVTISVVSNDLTEGTVLPAWVTFTTANWATPQTLTMTGIDDFVADGDQPYSVITNPATSADPDYSGLDPSDVSATNLDNE